MVLFLQKRVSVISGAKGVCDWGRTHIAVERKPKKTFGMVGLVSGELGGAWLRGVCAGPGRVALGAAVSFGEDSVSERVKSVR